MRSRAPSPGRLLGDTKVSRSTSHLQGTFLAHLVGGSGRSETSPTAILQGTHSLERQTGKFAEVGTGELTRKRLLPGSSVSRAQASNR
jgi:hypothetical protein